MAEGGGSRCEPKPSYAGDGAMRPQGKGGWRLDIQLRANDYRLTVNEDVMSKVVA